MRTITTLALVCAGALLAQDNVRIISGPTSIDSPGSYRLTRDTNGSITITANDVTLDLNGYSLTGPGGLNGMGIVVNGAQGVEVFGGSIHNFGFGVVVQGSANVSLHDLRIRATGLAVPAPPPEVGIMVVESPNVVIENNAIYDVGLGIFVRGGMSVGTRVANNTVTAGTNGLLGICFNPAPNDENGPRGALVYNNAVANFNGAISLSDLSKGNVLKENTLVYKAFAIRAMDESNMDVDNVKVEMP